MTAGNEDVVVEVEAASDSYEAALAAGDVEALVRAFWRSEAAVRIGDDEELFGWDAIAEHRRATGRVRVRRRVVRREITGFGADLATVHIVADYPGERRTGRQTQVWVRTPEGWRVAQAHVSWPLRSICAAPSGAEIRTKENR